VAYDWKHQAREWSKDWGGVEMQWHGSILPRIHAFIPTRCILEIGPGFGRWTHFLKDLCDRLIVVDLSKNCIRAYQHRFRNSSHISYHLNDRRSLDAVADGSVDFVFRFDSLVHIEVDVIESYLKQLASKLTPNGVGFIHHSNMSEYATYFLMLKKIPSETRLQLQLCRGVSAGSTPNPHLPLAMAESSRRSKMGCGTHRCPLLYSDFRNPPSLQGP
jgi:SAM-dependent methyltransferase